MPGPLAGIRVLDLTRVLAGPWAAQNLADLGAEVIKVERPKKGDDSRAFGPPWLKDAQGRDTIESAYFACANRGKKSITLDIAQPDGQAIVRELATRCDVLLVQATPQRLPLAEREWAEIWRGSRPGDRHELFILYQRR